MHSQLFLPNTVIARRYRLVSLAGQGAQTVVYQAQDERLSKTVALKFYVGSYAHDPMFRRRFEREVEILKSLAHPNLVHFYDSGEAEEYPYIVMDYLTGKSLKTLLAIQHRAPTPIAFAVVGGALAGLAYLHQNAILHRDFKPSSIFVDEAGRVTLADFDIAKRDLEEDITEKGAAVGSPRYMAPEQWRGGRADRRSDVFSAGAVLYELITGELPWDNGDYLPTDRRAWARLKLPSQVVRTATPEVDRVIATAIELQPIGRFPSAEEMLEAMKTAIRWAAPPDVIWWVNGRRVPENDLLATIAEKEPEKPPKIARETKTDKTRPQPTPFVILGWILLGLGLLALALGLASNFLVPGLLALVLIPLGVVFTVIAVVVLYLARRMH